MTNKRSGSHDNKKKTSRFSGHRDSARIGPILKAIESFWVLYPDLRLGQLISICSGTEDPFWIEDDRLIKNLLTELQLRNLK